jgi:ComEC/Rec2-related protein
MERTWLSVCAALALGEAAASAYPCLAEAWPAVAAFTLLTALWGFGLQVPGWRLLCFFSLGAAVFLFSSVEPERDFRGRPWMRRVSASRFSRDSGRSGAAEAVRREMSRRMGIGLEHSPESADVNRAILLGERSRLRPEVRRRFVESGTMHVFAISGLHVMVVAKFFCFLAALLAVPLRFRALAGVPLLWLYVWLIGFPPSAVRAALMASIYFSAPIFWRRPNALVAWSIAFLAIHVHSPALIRDVGCQLSFTVMLAIILAARFADGVSKAGQHVLVTLAAWASGVPIVACTFGVITPGGLLANFILVPAAGAAVISGLMGAMTSLVSERAA